MTIFALSFGSPIFLLALLAVPALIALQVANRQRGKRYAVRFTGVAALKLAAGTVPAWKRHLPVALLLAALAALALALARPERTVAVPIEKASIMLVTDHSRSMLAQDVEPDRMTAAKRAARRFLDQLPPTIRVGVTTYSDVPDGTQTPTRDHDLIQATIDAQVADGGTATGDALQVALDTLERQEDEGERIPAAIVLLSDGATTIGRDPVGVAQLAGEQRIPVYTVALGTRNATVPNPGFGAPTLPVPPDPETLEQIADASGGRAFQAQDDQQLSEIYETLGSRLGTRDEQREVTAAFAVGGMLLLLGAGAAAMHSAGRLP
ncbi:VWA domain-containing protein [Conexibacter stalactiti]|uniref:VWA domain-containing protein n=1 Tax=Conexibacter stalactiti TaxID=1940611 RepID=A0ABU4HN94_9ACTN|nr:VWA domain-containing protein [Conexibacter stalactiti]MDW5594781.1 VWA domain-containing protein [Conexibacter stalactiti]MEC5035423.1 VWA domain-containing protein [Conexibacter stalactiti]